LKAWWQVDPNQSEGSNIPKPPQPAIARYMSRCEPHRILVNAKTLRIVVKARPLAIPIGQGEIFASSATCARQLRVIR
jgi:hypothetical protein